MKNHSRLGVLLGSLVLTIALARPVEALWGQFFAAILTGSVTVSGPVIATGNITTATRLGVKQVTPRYGVHVSSDAIVVDGAGQNVMVSTMGVTMSSSTTPAGKANFGLIYYSTNNVFMVVENNGVPKPIVDPPGNWTCTLRSGAASAAIGPTLVSSTVSCSGVEKVLSGGCTLSGNSPAGSPLVSGGATGQGWTCSGISTAVSVLTVTAVANCCL